MRMPNGKAHSRKLLHELKSKLLKGFYIGDYMGDYYRGYEGGY